MPQKSPELVSKLQAQLRAAGWYELLKVLLVSADFAGIVEQLGQQVADGLRFTPPVGQLFQPFVLCPPDQVRVVLLTAGPHPGLGQADGLALSSSQAGRCPEGLYRVLEAIQQEFEQAVPGPPNLSRWAGQGVLLLNESLTTRLDRPASHAALWNPFLHYVLDRILARCTPAPFWVFYGLDAWWQDWAGPSPRHYFPRTPDELALALRAVNIRLGAEGHDAILW